MVFNRWIEKIQALGYNGKNTVVKSSVLSTWAEEHESKNRFLPRKNQTYISENGC